MNRIAHALFWSIVLTCGSLPLAQAVGPCIPEPDSNPPPECPYCEGDTEDNQCPPDVEGGNTQGSGASNQEPARIRGRIVYRDWRLGPLDYSAYNGSRWKDWPMEWPVTSDDYLRPLRHATVMIWERDDNGPDDFIGKAVTSSNGTFFFRLDYLDDSDERGYPDIYIKVRLEGALPFDGKQDWEGIGAIYTLGSSVEKLWSVELNDGLINGASDDCSPNSDRKCRVPFISTRNQPGGTVWEAGPGTHWINNGNPIVFGSDADVDIFRLDGSGTMNPGPFTTAANLFAYTDHFMRVNAEPLRGGSTLTCGRLLGNLAASCGNGGSPLRIQLWDAIPSGSPGDWSDGPKVVRINFGNRMADTTLADTLPHELGHWFHTSAGGSPPSSNPVDLGSGLQATTEPAALREGFAEFMKAYVNWFHDAPAPLSFNVWNDSNDRNWELSAPNASPWGAVRRTGKALWDFHDSRRDRNDCAPGARCIPTVLGVQDEVSHTLGRYYQTFVKLNDGSIDVGPSVSLWDWWEAYAAQWPDESENDARVLFLMHDFCDELTQDLDGNGDPAEDIFGVCD
ncbi:MAG: hypothetical protein AAF533_24170 [Acidobacteriota bacterium]